MTMKQWVTDYSGVASLRQEAVPLPTPQKDEVLVKISTVSVNYRDVEGEYWLLALLPSLFNCVAFSSVLLMRNSLRR
jgi:hypothetical protein